MEKLSFQDAFFLRAETSNCPFHVASLMIFSPPDNAPKNYVGALANKFGHLPTVWPVFKKKLENPNSTSNPHWVESDDYDPLDHIYHYALPGGAKETELLNLVSRAHEKLLDRTRPLWQVHVIEGLAKGQFAVYFKVHHALIDGAGGIKLMRDMLSSHTDEDLLSSKEEISKKRVSEMTWQKALKHSLDLIIKQSKAIPETSSLLASIGWNKLTGNKESIQLPFAAPRTILNTELGTRRRFITCELPVTQLKRIGRHFGGTINDVMVSICGGALRDYMQSIGELPEESMSAGIPVSVKSSHASLGNQLSFIICPFGSDINSPARRIKQIIRTTRNAKTKLSHMSAEANEDLATFFMVPFLMVTLSHSSQRFPPVFNAIVSNVPGPKSRMYLEGSRLERMYPFSVVTDGMGLNITLLSYQNRMCIGVTSAPGNEPNIESLSSLIKKQYVLHRDCLTNQK